MANGEDLEIKDYWDDVPQEDMTPVAVATKHCFIAMSKAYKDLPCRGRGISISRLWRFVWVLTGMGLIVSGVGIPVLIAIIENWTKIFSG